MKNRNLMLGIIIFLVIAILCVVTIGALLVYQSDSASVPIPPTVDIDQAVAEAAAAFTPTKTQPTNTPSITPSPTIQPTRTPRKSMTPVPSQTPIPTRSEDGVTDYPSPPDRNPAEKLGEPTWTDTFVNANNWTLFDEECFHTTIWGDFYWHNTKYKPAGLCWEVTWPRIQDFYLETISNVTRGCRENDRYGLVFRAPDTRTGYFFGINCRQEYWLSIWDGETGERTMLIDYTEFDRIAAPGTNKLGVWVNEDTVYLYINDYKVDQVYAPYLDDPGLFGYFIGSEQTRRLTIQYDYISYWAFR